MTQTTNHLGGQPGRNVTVPANHGVQLQLCADCRGKPSMTHQCRSIFWAPRTAERSERGDTPPHVRFSVCAAVRNHVAILCVTPAASS